jgi:hypothetical protein
MKRFTFAFVPAILLAMSVILIGTTAAGQSRIAEDQTAELKSLQKERIATLTQMVELLSHQIQSGAVANSASCSWRKWNYATPSWMRPTTWMSELLCSKIN